MEDNKQPIDLDQHSNILFFDVVDVLFIEASDI